MNNLKTLNLFKKSRISVKEVSNPFFRVSMTNIHMQLGDHIDLSSISHPSDMAELLKWYFSGLKHGIIAHYHMETLEKICSKPL